MTIFEDVLTRNQHRIHGDCTLVTTPRLSQTLEAKRSTKRTGKFANLIDKARRPIFLHDNAICAAGDFHVPFHDVDLMNKMFDMSEERGIKTLVVGGDWWDCNALSFHLQRVQVVENFEEECKYMQDTVRQVLNHYDHVYIATGNHEVRWMALTTGLLSIDQLWRNAIPHKMADIFENKVTITLDDHIHLYQDDQDWLLVHPKSYSVLPLSVAQRLAMKHQCHIVCFHGHNFAHGWDKSGKFRVIDGGGLFDKYSLDYARSTTAMPEMKSGFNLIIDNEVIPVEGK